MPHIACEKVTQNMDNRQTCDGHVGLCERLAVIETTLKDLPATTALAVVKAMAPTARPVDDVPWTKIVATLLAVAGAVLALAMGSGYPLPSPAKPPQVTQHGGQ